MSDRPMTRDRLLRILDDQGLKTERAIAGLDEATLGQPARGDGWTGKEILAHIASAYQGLLVLARAEAPSDAEPGAFDLDAHNERQRRHAQLMRTQDVLNWLARARREMRDYIEQADEAGFDRLVHTPWMGDHPLAQFLVFPALHEGGHRRELEQWRSTVPAAPGGHTR